MPPTPLAIALLAFVAPAEPLPTRAPAPAACLADPPAVHRARPIAPPASPPADRPARPQNRLAEPRTPCFVPEPFTTSGDSL